MTKTVEFFFDFISPATYLAYTQLAKIADRTGAGLIYRPFLLGGVFKSTGNAAPMTIPAKGTWLLKDLERCARDFGVPLNFNPHFPFNTVQLMRGAIWAQDQGVGPAYIDAVFRATWVEAKNVVDETVLAELLGGIAIDPAAFTAAVGDPVIKDRLKANTDEAVKRGAFGAPTMFIGDELFWGQDRLHQVEAMLAG
jgi:2-hydroxychromene-2-carboxylate isomerase